MIGRSVSVIGWLLIWLVGIDWGKRLANEIALSGQVSGALDGKMDTGIHTSR